MVGVVSGLRLARLTTEAGEATVGEDGAIEVRDRDGRLRLRFDGTQTEVLAAGDLRFDAPEGSLSFRARDRLVLESGGDVHQTAAGRLQQRAATIDVEAEAIFTRCRDAIEDVSSLLLTRAGRVRSLVRSGYTVLSKRTRIKSEKDTSIDGERVLLG